MSQLNEEEELSDWICSEERRLKDAIGYAEEMVAQALDNLEYEQNVLESLIQELKALNV